LLITITTTTTITIAAASINATTSIYSPFLGQSVSPGSLWVFLFWLLQKRTSSSTSFLQARCPSCHPVISVKALKEQNTNPDQQPDLILSLSSTGLLMEGHCFVYASSPVPIAVADQLLLYVQLASRRRIFSLEFL